MEKNFEKKNGAVLNKSSTHENFRKKIFLLCLGNEISIRITAAGVMKSIMFQGKNMKEKKESGRKNHFVFFMLFCDNIDTAPWFRVFVISTSRQLPRRNPTLTLLPSLLHHERTKKLEMKVTIQ